MADEKEDLTQSKALLDALKSQLSSNNYLGILASVAKDPPNCKDGDLQKEIAQPVLKALSKLKKSNMTSCLEKMDEKGRETVLQYVLYGFQAMPSASSEFLNWHRAIVTKDGIGALVRVSTNIKRNILVAANSMNE